MAALALDPPFRLSGGFARIGELNSPQIPVGLGEFQAEVVKTVLADRVHPEDPERPAQIGFQTHHVEFGFQFHKVLEAGDHGLRADKFRLRFLVEELVLNGHPAHPNGNGRRDRRAGFCGMIHAENCGRGEL